MLRQTLLPLSVLALAGTATAQFSPPFLDDVVVIPAGGTTIYDTSVKSVLAVDELVIEDGATLRVVGLQPLKILASRRIVIDGTLDASGSSGPDAVQLQSPGIPKQGGPSVLGSGAGGAASGVTDGSTPSGGPGFGLKYEPSRAGGRGGESALLMTSNATDRQGAGGGGGRLAADEWILGLPSDPANHGLVAQAGADGSSSATGAISGSQPPAGGAPGASVFRDADPANDFFGSRRLPNGQLVHGELAAPRAGAGGGGGGNSLNTNVSPMLPWIPSQEQSGAGGGSGGGLVLLGTRSFEMGPNGRVRVDGGGGGRGEGAGSLDPIAGGGGGGSGGMLMIQATRVDLSDATAAALSARGGLGGPGIGLEFFGDNHGGMGGPGLIQIHTQDAAQIQLPPGLELADLSAPDAKVLLPLVLQIP